MRARGELSLAVLIETMRREGFELSVSPPAVLFKTSPSGERQEPYEHVVVDVDDECVTHHRCNRCLWRQEFRSVLVP